MKILLSALLVVASCSFKKSQLQNQTLKGHEELYSEPDKPKLAKLDEFEKRIVIAATNDVHGNYQAQALTFIDDHQKQEQTVKVGGIDVVQNYFKILRDTYENVVLVDSGDIFSRASSSNTVRDFYSTLKYDAVTVGLRDFNLKLPSSMSSSSDLFKKFAKDSPTPLILSNLYELKTARVVEWEGTKPYLLKNVGGVKIGIIGLMADDIVANTPIHNRVGLYVENMIQSTLGNARLLRSLGADLIVVITHQGIDCNSELAAEAKLPGTKVNFEPLKQNVCNLKGVLGEYLERLPPQLVDVVIGGRNHQKTANFVNGTLVMSGFEDGKSFSFAEFIVNTKTKKVSADETVVHQPVIFCHEFFKETSDCYTEDPSVNHTKRIPATFLGTPIEVPGSKPPKEEPKVSGIIGKELVAKGLISFTADIAFFPKTTGQSQMFILAVQGRDLIRLLEEDYNQNRASNWLPSPYLEKDHELVLSVAGMEVENEKVYRILTDLESIQQYQMLTKHMSHPESIALMNHSWDSQNEDSVSTQLAAQTR